MGLSTVAIGLRMYCRKTQALSVGIDDWTALFGVVTFIGVCALAIRLVVMEAFGYGHPTDAQAAARLKPMIQIGLAYDFLVTNTLACAKLSAVFLYRRILNVPKRGHFNTITMATVAVILAWYITFDVLSLLQCRSHFSAFWSGDFKKYCTLNLTWAQGFAISDLILDIWVLLLPIPRIWSLHISVTKKLSVIGVFLLAFVGLGASVARVAIFFLYTAPGRAVLFIGVLEAGMTITVVNLPPIWYICVLTVQRNLASLSRHRTGKTDSSHGNSGTSSNVLDTQAAPSANVTRSSVSWDSEVGGPLPVHEFRMDAEKGGIQTYTVTAQGPHGVEAVKGRPGDLPANVTRVQNEVEVNRD